MARIHVLYGAVVAVILAAMCVHPSVCANIKDYDSDETWMMTTDNVE